jgi:hypothetical protein
VRQGTWQLLNCALAGKGNHSWNDLICFTWTGAEQQLLIVVNYAPHQSQGYVMLSNDQLLGKTYLLNDLMSSTVYERSGDRLMTGLYVDLPAWGYHVFDL